MKLTTAYCSFVNGGKLVKPIMIDRIQDSEGLTIYNSEQRTCDDCEQITFDSSKVPKILDNFNQIFLEKKDVELILDGRPIKMKDFKNGDGFLEKQIALAKFENEFVAVGYLKDGNFYPKNLLNNLFV